MTQILSEYSKPKLIASIHESWDLCMNRIFSGNPQAEYRVTPNHTFLCSQVKIGWLNRVMKTNLTPEGADKMIQARALTSGRPLRCT